MSDRPTLDTAVEGSRLLLQALTAVRPAIVVPTGDAFAHKLETVPHRHLNLTVDGKHGPHRPDLSIWPSADEDQPPALVSITVAPMFGQQRRYIEMSPEEARILAKHLIETADLIDREVASGG